MKKVREAFILSCLILAVTMGMSHLSQGAPRWQEQEDGTWACYDKDGNLIKDRWEKYRGLYYYLDENGQMAANRLIDDGSGIYYVGEDGARITKQWLCLPNEFDFWPEENEIMNVWYYFGHSGRAYMDGKKTIDGKTYLFDEEGHMLSGWQRLENGDDWYYLGTENEGWARAGWQNLEPAMDMEGDYEAEEWFYFSPGTGKLCQSKRKKIEGSYYQFDENGVMLDEWVTPVPGLATGSQAYYVEDTGEAGSGWVYLEDPDEDGEMYWYYLERDGVPFNLGGKDSGGDPQGATAIVYDEDGWSRLTPHVKCAARKIKGKKYIFNEKGQMMTGYIHAIGVPCKGGAMLGGEPEGFYYYFNAEEGSPKEGQMMTGKQKITVDGGGSYEHVYLREDGRAYTGIIADGALYGQDGIRMYAEDGRYDILYISGSIKIVVKGGGRTLTDCLIIVNSYGQVKKSGSVTFEGYRYTVENYVLVDFEEVD